MRFLACLANVLVCLLGTEMRWWDELWCTVKLQGFVSPVQHQTPLTDACSLDSRARSFVSVMLPVHAPEQCTGTHVMLFFLSSMLAGGSYAPCVACGANQVSPPGSPSSNWCQCTAGNGLLVTVPPTTGRAHVHLLGGTVLLAQ